MTGQRTVPMIARRRTLAGRGRHSTRTFIGVLVTVLLATTAGQDSASAAARSVSHGRSRAAHVASVVELPVVFRVNNVNGSQIPCPSDGLGYEIRGFLVTPQNVPPSVTVWLHGATAGEWQWHFRSLPRYDFATEMARLGHASVVIDRLGFDASGHPMGTDVCVGSEADVAHQIIQRLKSGDYLAGHGDGPPFSRVALGGNSFGGMITESEAVSFHDADALIVNGWADAPITGVVKINEVFPQAATTCGQGGESAEGGSSPSGYSYLWPSAESEAEDIFYNVDPRVSERFATLRNRDACGNVSSVGAAVTANNALIGTINTPVLLVYGDHDLVTPIEADIQRARYTESADVSLAIIPNTGHVGMIERTASSFRAAISEWLGARGF